MNDGYLTRALSGETGGAMAAAIAVVLGSVSPAVSQQLPAQHEILMAAATGKTPEPVKVTGWDHKALWPYLMFPEPNGSAAEIGAHKVFGDQFLTTWVYDLDGDGTGEMLVYLGDHCARNDPDPEHPNCTYAMLAWNGSAWKVAMTHMARRVHLALGHNGVAGFAFDGMAFGYSKGEAIPIGGDDWEVVTETEIPELLKDLEVKRADDIEFVTLPFDPPEEEEIAENDNEAPTALPNWEPQPPDVMVRQFEPFNVGSEDRLATLTTDGIELIMGNRLRLVRGAVTGGYRWALIFNRARLTFGFSEVSPVAVKNLSGDLVIATLENGKIKELRIASKRKQR